MFNKPKNLKSVPRFVNEPVTEEMLHQDRNSVLSDWGVSTDASGFQEQAYEQNKVATSPKKGFVICPKCLSVVPATESRCVSCGFNQKNI